MVHSNVVTCGICCASCSRLIDLYCEDVGTWAIPPNLPLLRIFGKHLPALLRKDVSGNFIQWRTVLTAVLHNCRIPTKDGKDRTEPFQPRSKRSGPVPVRTEYRTRINQKPEFSHWSRLNTTCVLKKTEEFSWSKRKLHSSLILEVFYVVWRQKPHFCL